jgi:hypothetical protein
MAFSGVHAICGFVGGDGFSKSPSLSTTMPVICKPVWSEAPSTGVTSTNVAPAGSSNGAACRTGQPMMRFRASADSWVSVGSTPDATSGTRFLVPSDTDYDVYVEAGDKFQWIAA